MYIKKKQRVVFGSVHGTTCTHSLRASLALMVPEHAVAPTATAETHS